MADLARIARPWLLSLRRPVRAPVAASPYTGLVYGRGISTTPACLKLQKSSSVAGGYSARERRMKDKAQQSKVLASFLLPYTIVPPPFWRFPLSPTKFAQTAWLVGKNRATALGSLIAIKFTSMRVKGWGWPKFSARKRSAIPAAKALHAQMSEAVAAADKETLRRICTHEMFQTLAGAIDARPSRIRAEWELVRYDNRLRYPRVADFRVMYQESGTGRGMRIIKQAVVSLSSVQRLTRYDDADGGAVVPGTGHERHMVEHLVLLSAVEDGTFETGPWKIWGTLPEMSFETMHNDEMMYDEALSRKPEK